LSGFLGSSFFGVCDLFFEASFISKGFGLFLGGDVFLGCFVFGSSSELEIS